MSIPGTEYSLPPLLSSTRTSLFNIPATLKHLDIMLEAGNPRRHHARHGRGELLLEYAEKLEVLKADCRAC